MAVTLEKEELERVLEVTKLGLAKSDLIPALQTFRIEGSTISSWNDVLSVSVDLGTPLVDEGVVCPKGADLTNFVKRTDGEMVSLEAQEDSLKASSGTTSMRIPIRDASEFPSLPTGNDQDMVWSAQVNASETEFALDKCLKTVGSQKDFLIYNGICIGEDPDTNSLTFYSSDDVSLSKYRTSEKLTNAKEWALVPKEFAKAVVVALGKLNEEQQDMSISVYRNFVKVVLHSGVTLMGRRIAGNPPDYNLPIKHFVEENVTSDDDMFPVSPFIKDTITRMKGILPKDADVTVEVNGDQLLLVSDESTGRVTDQVDLPYHMKESSATVSVDRLAKAANAGDFMFISKDCVGVMNGPLDEASYTHLVSVSNN